MIRYLPFAIVILATAVLGVAWLAGVAWGGWAMITAALAAIGIHDLLQPRRAVLRNYPLLGHFRYMFESVRPELRQYLFESDLDGVPFSRQQRAIVYQRAKRALDKRPFGTQRDVYQPGFEWINHSLTPTQVASHDFRIMVGGPACSAAFSLSVLNISALSFGA